MSKKEMENLDEQVLQVANSAGEARCADEAQQADREAERRDAMRVNQISAEQKRKAEQVAARKKMQGMLKMLAKVAACLVAAAVFLALLLDPVFWVPVIGYVGIMTFIVVGAICVDRHVRLMKGWR